MKPDISVLICTYNRSTILRETLESLQRVLIPAKVSVELLVVDNGSTDDTREIVNSHKFSNMMTRYMYEPQRGKSYAYNKGLVAAKGDILLCTDDDVCFPVNWIAGMCKPILSRECEAVAGGIKLAPYLERSWMRSFHRGKLGSTENMADRSNAMLFGANMAFSKAVLRDIPAFDTELGPVGLGTHEETLFSLQLKEAGYKIGAAFDVCVEHYAQEVLLLRSSFLDRARKSGRSHAYITHHWEHKVITHPYRRLIFYNLYLNYLRLKHWKEWFTWLKLGEGAPEWELSLTEAIYFYKQYLVERKRPRNYEKRGLAKAQWF